jgi:signal transduction histidine kinase/DNA-binding response OmpR family regulator
MRVSLRMKLGAIVAAALAAVVVLTTASAIYENRIADHVASIQQSYLPKIRVRPRLEAAFERLNRAFKDATDANDLELANRERTALVAMLVDASDALSSGEIAAVRVAIDDHYSAASEVSRKMIAGESGEALINEIHAMQDRQQRTSQLIDQVTTVDERALEAAFDSTTELHGTAIIVRLIAGLICAIAVLVLSLWIGRGVVRSLAHLIAGFRRFGDGDFSRPIPSIDDDELGDVARQANAMAGRLEQLDAERARRDWIKAGHAGTVDAIRGELDPDEVAARALAFLVRHQRAAAGVVYAGPPGGPFERIASHGLSRADLADAVTLGEGLVGTAAQRVEVSTVDGGPTGMKLRSGLADVIAHELVLVPLLQDAAVVGVLELAFITRATDADHELLVLVRTPIAIAIGVARSRSATRALLVESQRQARELAEAHRDLEHKADELAKASLYKSQFLANMSHELRTPLNAIIGFSELLYDDAVPADAPQAKEFLNDILTSGRHLLGLINDVLDLAKVESGKLEFHPEPCRLSMVIGEVVGILRTTATSKGLRIETAIPSALDDVNLDPARLKQVFYNFLSNALKFTPAGGRVIARVLPEDGDCIRIEVEDTGRGIALEEQVRLFVEFQQAREGAKRIDGTGLGLALTKRIVEAQGGSVGVRSVVGEGSVFHAVLPRRHVLNVPAAVASLAVARSPMVNAARVLVVEDDPLFRVGLAETLMSAGYAVESVATGTEALARCKVRDFDAITLDLILPDMAGLSVLHALRESRNRTAPVIVITLVAEPGAVAGFAVHDILAKPLDDERLLQSLLRAGVEPGKATTILVVDDEAASLKVMAATLTQLGYDARCTSDPVSALRSVHDAPPAAIVLDLIMPKLTGFEFLDQLRDDPHGRNIPVIVWTSKDLTADEISRLAVSAQAVVSKGHDGNHRVVAELAALLPPRLAQAEVTSPRPAPSPVPHLAGSGT